MLLNFLSHVARYPTIYIGGVEVNSHRLSHSSQPEFIKVHIGLHTYSFSSLRLQ
jgi:hypothetical protein